MTVFARGLLDRLFTRIYLPCDPALATDPLAADPLLRAVAPDRRRTLVAVRDADGLRFDVRLQGDRETVFLAHVRPEVRRVHPEVRRVHHQSLLIVAETGLTVNSARCCVWARRARSG